MQLRRLVLATLVCTALLGVSVGDASVARDASATDRTTGDDALCLISKTDYSISNTSIEVTQQTSDPLIVSNMYIESHQFEDKDWIIYDTAYIHAEELCAQLSVTEPGAVKVTLEGVEIHDLSVRGPASELGFTYGESDEIVLWISMKSALKLLPSLIGSSAVDPPNSSTTNATTTVADPSVGATP